MYNEAKDDLLTCCAESSLKQTNFSNHKKGALINPVKSCLVQGGRLDDQKEQRHWIVRIRVIDELRLVLQQ